MTRLPAELHMYPDQPHAFIRQKHFHRLSCREISIFLKRYLGLMPHVKMAQIPGIA